jgi:hypothetical protein
MIKVEHIEQRASQCIEGAVSNSAQVPIVLNEPNNGGLIGESIINKVLLRKWRND